MTATQEARIIPLDPRDRSTHVNIACPVDLSAVQNELTRVGGLNPHGAPNFIIVWAQEHRTWDSGRMRIHFDEEAIPAVHTPNRWAVTSDVYARAVRWLETESQRRRDAYTSLDWTGLNRFPDVGDYLAAHELSDNYMKLPSGQDDLNQLIKLMPDGWMYIPGLWSFEHIGQQCFYVLQWFGPAEFGSEDVWNELRFAEQYMPETDRVEPLVDVLGPYPSHGQHENPCLRICEIETYDDDHPVEIGTKITREICRFKMPTLENVVEPLRELLKIRDRLSNMQKSAAERTAARFRDFHRTAPDRRERAQKNFHERFDAAKPVGKGNPTNISSNKSKAN